MTLPVEEHSSLKRSNEYTNIPSEKHLFSKKYCTDHIEDKQKVSNGTPATFLKFEISERSGLGLIGAY
jgi:hypothetical protein